LLRPGPRTGIVQTGQINSLAGLPRIGISPAMATLFPHLGQAEVDVSFIAGAILPRFGRKKIARRYVPLSHGYTGSAALGAHGILRGASQVVAARPAVELGAAFFGLSSELADNQEGHTEAQ
jgi:hypothetical protein